MQFEEFKRAVSGRWHGTNQLFMGPPPVAGISSASQLRAAPAVGGCFLQFDYSWTYEGAEETGLLLLGYDEENAASAAWVDSFHMSSKIMFCTGTAADGVVTVLGTYSAPPEPDWGWRMAIQAVSARELQVLMHNITPAGEEALAVQIDYTRVG